MLKHLGCLSEQNSKEKQGNVRITPGPIGS